MALRDSAIRATAKGFDIERKLIAPNVKSLQLIRQKLDNTWERLLIFKSGFIRREDTFRNVSTFEIATLQDISEQAILTSFVEYGGRVYEIEESDISIPDSSRFTWLFTGHLRSSLVLPDIF